MTYDPYLDALSNDLDWDDDDDYDPYYDDPYYGDWEGED